MREQAPRSKLSAYCASKTLAERAAWDFVADPANGAKFTLAVIAPPLILGPIVRPTADSINTSSQRIHAPITGEWREGAPATGVPLNYVDVRDCAEAHVRAGIDRAEACAGVRFFCTGGEMCNKDIVEAIRKNFPEYEEKLPSKDNKGGEKPEGRYRWEAPKRALLGIEWRSLEESVVASVKSLKTVM